MKTNLFAILRAFSAVNRAGLLAIFLLVTCAMHAAPLFTEEYPATYGEGTRLGTDQATGGYNTKWPNGNSIGTGSATNTIAGALTHSPLLPISGTASYGMRISTATSRNTIAPITPSPSGDGSSVYWSFLINVTATTPTARIIGGFRNSTGTGNQSLSIGISATRQLQLYKNSAVVATHGTTLTAGTTYFVVGRYKFVAGTGVDEVALWLNPATGNSSEPTPDNSSATGTDQTSVVSLQLLSASDASGPLYLDEHRVSTNWADATPAAGPCVAPGITNQPVAVTACQGDIAVFTVGASGTALTYQWQKNGSPISNGPTGNGSTNSGVTTATLTVSSVAAADAALAGVGYDCIITNGCGTTNSDRVALSVNTSPAQFAVTGGGSYCVGGGGVAVGVAGSESGVTYYLRLNGANNGATTNGTGASLNFGNQTVAGTYTVIATNGGGCSALMTTNAVVVVNTVPGITTEPVAATTAVGGSATFTVVATGGSLTYLWNKNGVTISTATNASYTIYPATLGDAALAANGYDCTITGPCGSTNSARVALTVNATSDLIWAGDGAANLWNTLGAANWSNGVSLVQFTSGDRVTFDDSTANLSPVLSGVQIPTSVAVNAAANYTFTGSGSVGGSLATLTKAGTGTLTLGTAHSYGGGTVISNGTIVISNNASLGTGPATLAGGSLTTIGARSLANGLNATATGTLTYTGTGDNSLNLNSTFNVAGGTTLTITHAAAGPDRLRVFDTNTTVNGDIVLNGAGIAFACYSANGTQTFNGIISGNGQVMRRSGSPGVAGTTIFNGANTYSGTTTLTDGSIGFGVSTVGAITSGPVGTGTLALGDSGNAPSLKHLFASGGARSIANPITVAGAQTNTLGGTFALTFDGTVNLGGATRVFNVTNTAATTLAGVITNGGITKLGNGTLILNGQNTYVGPTVINGGTLGGTGVVSGPVTIAAAGNLAPGASIGTLTVSNDVTLSGTFTAEVDTGASPNCDRVVGISNVVFGGTLAIVNIGPALTASDTFQLFSALTYNGAFASITPATPGASLVWNTNTLTTDGTLRIASTGGASSDANLSGLVVTPAGTLSPGFDSNTTTYAASETYANSPITVTPTSADAGAVIQIIYGGATNVVTSGNPSGALALDANPSVPNVVQVRVTAADTTTVKNYTVTVTRQPSTTPTTLAKVSSGGNLTMSWPLDHTGWTLQTQTNARSVGLTMPTNTWFDVSGSTATNLLVIPISSGNPTVFYRLMLFIP